MELTNTNHNKYPKINRIFQLGILLSLILTGCSSLGENFFIRNYEDNPVTIKYTYYKNKIDGTGFDFQPKNFVLISDTLLSKKTLRQFPYRSETNFDSIKVENISSLSYEVEIPAKSTIRIAPIYHIQNIQSIIINNTDTIRFVSDYPHLENEGFTDQDIVKYKPRIIGDSYYILNLKQIDISRVLNN